MELSFTDIENNKPLYEFCRKIWSYKIALESDKKYLFLASFVGAGIILDKESCLESLDTINFILKNIELFDLGDLLKKEVVSFLTKEKKMMKKELSTM